MITEEDVRASAKEANQGEPRFEEMKFNAVDGMLRGEQRHIFIHDTFGKCAQFFNYAA
jgi:hypothetical protein